jgi:hypothetical protein
MIGLGSGSLCFGFSRASGLRTNQHSEAISDCRSRDEALRKIAFEERLKIHDVVLEGIDLALRRCGYASIERLRAGKKR